MLIYSKNHANIWNVTPKITPIFGMLLQKSRHFTPQPSPLTPQPSPLNPQPLPPLMSPKKHDKGALPKECTFVCMNKG